MIVIRDRAEYRDHLKYIVKRTRSQRDILIQKKALRHLDGVIFGLKLALEALDEWERQQPDDLSKSIGVTNE